METETFIEQNKMKTQNANKCSEQYNMSGSVWQS